MLVLAVVALAWPARAQGRAAAEDDGPPSQARVDRAIALGVSYLRGVHGEHDRFGSGSRFGEEALALYALVKSGVPLDDPVVVRGFEFLQTLEVHGTYDLGVGLLLLRSLGEDAPLPWMQQLLERLLAGQNGAGDWGYPGGADLSNTQYAALGLWAAAEQGLTVDAKVWRDLQAGVERYGSRDGGHAYSAGSGASTGSMTAAAAATYALIDAQLLDDGPAQREHRRDLLERSLEWLGRRFTPTSNPGGAWPYYWLYGVERVGALAGTSLLGDHDWYAEGARHLLEDQETSGRWGGGVVQTAFALLFLQRATAKPPQTGRSKVPSYRTAEADAPFTIVATGTSELAQWVTGWNEEVLADVLWPGERTPRVLRLEWLVGDRVVDVRLGGRDRATGDARYPTRTTFRADGPVALRARAHLVGPPREGPGGREYPGELRVVETPALAAEVTGVPQPWRHERLELFRAGRLGPDGVEARSRSVHSPTGGPKTSPFAARHAVDGDARRPWLADPDDERSVLVIELKKPREVSGLALLQPSTVPFRAGAMGRLLDAEVRLDGEDPLRVRFHPDERRPGLLTLPEPRRVRRIEITLGMRLPGTEVVPSGLAEVLLVD